MENKIQIKYDLELYDIDVRELYDDAGWVVYTNNMLKLMDAIKNSLKVVTAWDKDKLVGLVRVVGDGETIIYIQDILVLNTYKRLGIGTRLLSAIFEEYKDVRQKVLLTHDSDETRGFYESIGFKSCDKGDLVAFVRFD